MVIPDTPQNRAKYEEQVIRTFYISHADATELAQIINTIIRVPQMPVQPTVMANKTANTITIRATTAVADVIERIIRANDKPRAEVAIDVQILEVNRSRARQFGLNLSDYSIGAIFSPSQPPGTGTSGGSSSTHHEPVQPEHDHAGREHRRLLPVGADGRRSSSSRATRRPSSSPSRSCAAPRAPS